MRYAMRICALFIMVQWYHVSQLARPTQGHQEVVVLTMMRSKDTWPVQEEREQRSTNNNRGMDNRLLPLALHQHLHYQKHCHYKQQQYHQCRDL
jgi:hypothetical protein